VKSSEINWMDFEARTKKLVNTVIEPFVTRNLEDGKTLFKLDCLQAKTDNRLKVIEAALFKADQSRTLFDDFSERLLNMEVN
jgi:hypothetical protein